MTDNLQQPISQSETQPMQAPTLYLFPVPMGQGAVLNVLPARNVELLRSVKHFIVENARSARRFIKACDRDIDIDSLSIVELNRHTPPQAVATMLEPMERGCSVGVISEAGCPAVADPGADVVAIAQRRGYRVVPLVGPSSIIMSVMGSGFNGQSFAFNGYLPIDSAERSAKLREMERRVRKERQTQIFIETPYRNAKLLQWLCQALGPDMLLCVATDITGPAESIRSMAIKDWRRQRLEIDKLPTIFLLYS